MHLVGSIADVDALEVRDPERLASVTQTTLSVDDTAEIVAALRRRFPGLARPRREDICYATQNRQDAVRELASTCDAILVVGSSNSSNSLRLVEVAERAGCPARLVDGIGDVDPSWLAGARTVGVTAGASAPEELVRAVLDHLAPTQGVELVTVTEEEEYFPPPRELRDLVRAVSTAAAAALLAPVTESGVALSGDRSIAASDVLDALAS